MRHGFIAIVEGMKGEGWLRFATMLTKVVASSSILEVDNNEKQSAPLYCNFVSGNKGSFLEVLKKSSQFSVVHSSFKRR